MIILFSVVGGITDEFGMFAQNALETGSNTNELTTDDCEQMLSPLDLHYLETALDGDNVWDFLEVSLTDYFHVNTAANCDFNGSGGCSGICFHVSAPLYFQDNCDRIIRK